MRRAKLDLGPIRNFADVSFGEDTAGGLYLLTSGNAIYC
jgi:hypothetical protein